MPRKTTAPDVKWNPWLRPSKIRKKVGPRPAGSADDPDREAKLANQRAFDELPKKVREVLRYAQIPGDCQLMVDMLKARKLTQKQLIAMLRVHILR